MPKGSLDDVRFGSKADIEDHGVTGRLADHAWKVFGELGSWLSCHQEAVAYPVFDTANSGWNEMPDPVEIVSSDPHPFASEK